MKLPAAGELHGRAIQEWRGKSLDTPVPAHVKLRILLRQNRRCAITRALIRPQDRFAADHIIRLKDGGENRESNLQIILVPPHKEKSARERTSGAKVVRIARKHYGLKRAKKPFPGGRDSPWIKHVNGKVEKRI